MIGENFCFTVTFENTGVDPGYGPFIDLVFPLTDKMVTTGQYNWRQVIQAVLTDVEQIQ